METVAIPEVCSVCKNSPKGTNRLRRDDEKVRLRGFVKDIREPICCSCSEVLYPRGRRFKKLSDNSKRYGVEQAIQRCARGVLDNQCEVMIEVAREEARTMNFKISKTIRDLQRMVQCQNVFLTLQKELERAYGELALKQYSSRRKEASFAISRTAMRVAVFTRDEWKCKKCGERDHLSLDHVISVFDGGGDEIENLQALCRKCNSRKGKKSE